VVSKQPRVVEEVVIRKDVQERTETVRDKVRRSDVEVERTAGQQDGQIADRFAQELAQDQRYRGRDWKTIENDAYKSFQQRYPNSRLEHFNDAISNGYERMRQRV